MTLIVLQKKALENTPRPPAPSLSVLSAIQSLQKQYPTSTVTWSPNEIHFGWILHDVIRVASNGEPVKIFSVDVHHIESSRMTAEYNALLRKTYLARKGIQTIQVAANYHDLTQGEID